MDDASSQDGPLFESLPERTNLPPVESDITIRPQLVVNPGHVARPQRRDDHAAESEPECCHERCRGLAYRQTESHRDRWPRLRPAAPALWRHKTDGRM